MCCENWLIGYDSLSIFLPVGEVTAQQGSVPPNGPLSAWGNRAAIGYVRKTVLKHKDIGKEGC